MISFNTNKQTKKSQTKQTKHNKSKNKTKQNRIGHFYWAGKAQTSSFGRRGVIKQKYLPTNFKKKTVCAHFGVQYSEL